MNMEIEMEEENNIDNLNDEYELASKLKDLGIFQYICGNNRLNIQKLQLNRPS